MAYTLQGPDLQPARRLKKQSGQYHYAEFLQTPTDEPNIGYVILGARSATVPHCALP